MTSDRLSAADTIVIKLGSALIVDKASGSVRAEWMSALAEDIAALTRSGKRVLLVSSGAAAIGRTFLNPDTSAKLGPMERKQAAAALGQPRLMTALQSAFDPVGLGLADSLGNFFHERLIFKAETHFCCDGKITWNHFFNRADNIKQSMGFF